MNKAKKKLIALLLTIAIASTMSVTALAVKPTNPAISSGVTKEITFPLSSGSKTVEGNSSRAEAEQMLFEVNKERQKEGLEPLKWNESLYPSAEIRAFEATEKWDHERPNGQMPESLDSKINGENLQKNGLNAAHATANLMTSSGHKANILRPNFKSAAFACVEVADGPTTKILWVQLFSYEDVQGSTPSKPEEKPSKPTTPSKPEEKPSKPTTPSKPEEKPSKPTTPSKPEEKPSKPTTPNKPEEKPSLGESGKPPVKPQPKPEPEKKPNNSSNSGSKGSGGGGKGWTNKNVGTTHVDRAVVYTPNANKTTTTKKVTNTVTEENVINTLANVVKNGNKEVATFNNVGNVPANVLTAVKNWATTNAPNAVMNFDTVSVKNEKQIQGRLTLPTGYTDANGVSTVVRTEGNNVDSIAKIFVKYFSNKIQVVELEQQGNFTAPVRIAAKLNSFDDTNTLVLYSYNHKTNTYLQLENNGDYTIDKNGYVHFTTSVGGYIVISQNALVNA